MEGAKPTFDTEFTTEQLAQLRSVVQDAMRQHMQQIEANLCSRLADPPGPKKDAAPRGKRPDDAVENCVLEESGPEEKGCAITAAGPPIAAARERPIQPPAEPGSNHDINRLASSTSKFDKAKTRTVLIENCAIHSSQLKVQTLEDFEAGDTILIRFTQSGLRRQEKCKIRHIDETDSSFIVEGEMEHAYPLGSEILKQERSSWIEKVADIVNTQRFDAVMGFIIVVNSATIGLDTQAKLDAHDTGGDPPTYLLVMESCFLSAFLFELVLRLIANGKCNFRDGWFWFDATLVFTGVVSTWIIEPIIKAEGAENAPVVSQLLTMRVLRLLRSVRALRLMEQFRELWKLCSGLMKSARTLLSVCLLVLLAIYTFACLGVDLITKSQALKDNPETNDIVELHFSTLPDAMLTLMQFANADSIWCIYFPICREEPLLVFYFLPLWLVVTVALMNLVTAIIVENAMAKGREDAEERDNHVRKTLKRVLPQIRKVFAKLDEDASGTLTIAEIKEKTELGMFKLPEEIQAYVHPEKLLDVFQFLDTDQSGEIDEDEFVEGIESLALSSVPIETTQILQLLRHTHQIIVDRTKLWEDTFSRENRRSQGDTQWLCSHTDFF